LGNDKESASNSVEGKDNQNTKTAIV